MPTLIPKPTTMEVMGNKPIAIDEYVGCVNTRETRISIATLRCPPGWIEAGQTPEFDEYTLVLRGTLRIGHRDGVIEVQAGQAILTHANEWVQYSTPESEGAEYVAVCLPAYTPGMAHPDP